MKKTSIITVLLFASVSAHAEVTLNAIFADHMVLQRDRPVSVYGLAEPGEQVTVDFAGQTKSGTGRVKKTQPNRKRA
ncbi:MAG: sialate O-acetylesterase [Verrucomicrobiales bacterium]|jgi:sialate O-acetylesterase